MINHFKLYLHRKDLCIPQHIFKINISLPEIRVFLRLDDFLFSSKIFEIKCVKIGLK